jgi:hypothetical protein
MAARRFETHLQATNMPAIGAVAGLTAVELAPTKKRACAPSCHNSFEGIR